MTRPSSRYEKRFTNPVSEAEIGVMRRWKSRLGRRIKVAVADHSPCLVGDAAKTDPESIKTKSLALVTIIAPVMVVTMKSLPHAHAPRELVDGIETMPVATGRFVCHEDVRALTDQRTVVLWENRAAMFATTLVALRLDKRLITRRRLQHSERVLPSDLRRIPY